MPRYRIDFTAESQTAKAVMEIMIDQVSDFTMSIVEDQHTEQTGGPKRQRARREIGTTGHGRVFELAKSLGGTVSRARVKQMLQRLGYNDNSLSAILTRLKAAGVAELTEDGKSIKLKDLRMTTESVNILVREYEASLPSRKK